MILSQWEDSVVFASDREFIRMITSFCYTHTFLGLPLQVVVVVLLLAVVVLVVVIIVVVVPQLGMLLGMSRVLTYFVQRISAWWMEDAFALGSLGRGLEIWVPW